MSISVTIDGNHPTFSSLDASIRTRWSSHLRSPCQDASYAITSSRPPHIRRVSVRLWRDQRHFRGKTLERCTWCVRGPHFRAWTPPCAPDGAITCARHVKTHRMPSHQDGRHTYAVFRCVYGVIGVISGAKLSRGAPDVGIIRTRWSSHLRSPCQDASYAITSRWPPHIRRVSVRLWRDQRSLTLSSAICPSFLSFYFPL